MIFTWVPQLRGHIIKQAAKRALTFIVMLAIAWLLPSAIALGSRTLGVDDAAIRPLVTIHPYLVLFVYGYIWITHEMLVYKFLGGIAEADKYRPGHLLAQLAKKALLRSTPHLVHTESTKLFGIAAITSVFKRHHILVHKDLLPLLNEREQEVIYAHEITHLKHKDIWNYQIIRAGDLLCSLYLWFSWCMLFADILVWNSLKHFWFWGLSILVSGALRIAYTILSLAHSRASEYLADAGAALLAGWNYRRDLIQGLYKLEAQREYTGFLGFVMRIWPELLRTHPRIRSRARALGIHVIPTGTPFPLLVDLRAEKK